MAVGAAIGLEENRPARLYIYRYMYISATSNWQHLQRQLATGNQQHAHQQLATCSRTAATTRGQRLPT